MASALDDAEVAAMTATRIRAWDDFAIAVTQSQITAINNPTTLAGEGIRFLNGTPTMPPGNAANANT